MTIAWLELGFFVGVILLGVILNSWVKKQIAARPWIGIAFAVLMVVAPIHAVYQFAIQHDAADPVWSPKARIWARVPLRVKYNRGAFKDYESAIAAVFTLYNKDVGCDLLVPAADEDFDIELVSFDGAPCAIDDENNDHFLDKHVPAGAFLCKDGRGQVQVLRLDALEDAYPILAHEFGHELGLDHYSGSFMSDDEDISRLPFQQVRISRPAKTELRKRYCGDGK